MEGFSHDKEGEPIFDARKEEHEIKIFEAPTPEVTAELDAVHDATHHDHNLYDQDESRSGERTDLATGRQIDNSTYTGLENLSVRDNHDTEDDMAGDAADRWLKEAEKKLKEGDKEAA